MTRLASHRQQGATLIEVLVAALILSVGLLGLAGLQVTSVKSNQSAYIRSQATLLAYDIADRMRTNRAEALNGAYDLELTTRSCNTSLNASGTLAEKDKAEWLNNLSCLLSSDAKGSIARNGAVFTITIKWDDKRGDVRLTPSTELQEFIYRTQL